MAEPKTVEIEVNGQRVQARAGQMLIELTDAMGIAVPRFCYHPRLSVAANCRMCLIEVEQAPKPLPACATPITAGMKVHTHSDSSRQAQQGTMEFLLINHPLDCPICDQGGECELQDVALRFGASHSRYKEEKRAVEDPDLGPLIATEMTRCIHCTRCLRFGEEIAGELELGGLGRGEDMRIANVLGSSMQSELSANIIDLCPVGALTAKPSRFQARSWEMRQHPAVANHDAVGSNLYLHSHAKRIVRVVPRSNDAINECWLSDRDRFSYQGLEHPDRLLTPLLRTADGLRPIEWDEALNLACQRLTEISIKKDALGMLVNPRASVEEMFLSQQLLRGLNSAHIDHRLRQLDHRSDIGMPWLGCQIDDLPQQRAMLLIGANVRKEQPLIAHRLKQAVERGGQLFTINPRHYPMHFPVAASVVVRADKLPSQLATLQQLLQGTNSSDQPTLATIASALQEHAEQGIILLGEAAINHPQQSLILALAAAIGRHTGCRIGLLTAGANAAGAWLAGALPQRLPGGKPATQQGRNAHAMFSPPLDGYLLLGVEPEYDCADVGVTLRGLKAARSVIALSAFNSPALAEYAELVLPIAELGESAASYVNAEGRWQYMDAAIPPPGDAQPAWRILNALGSKLQLSGFQLPTFSLLRQRVQQQCQTPATAPNIPSTTESPATDPAPLLRCGHVPPLAADALLRRAEALQQSGDAENSPTVTLATAQATLLQLQAGDRIEAQQGSQRMVVTVRIDDAVPIGCAWIPAVTGSALGPCHEAVTLHPISAA